MGLGDFIKESLPGQKAGTLNLRTIYDPADILGGQAASDAAKAAERSMLTAELNAIRAQERMRKESLALGEPYRKMGYAALPGLVESLQPGSKLGTMRSRMAKDFIGKRLGKFGFSPEVGRAGESRAMRRILPTEEASRYGRAEDLMRLGAGMTAEGAGYAGQAGRGLADIYLRGAAQQSQYLGQEQAARREMTRAGMIGARRGLGEYMGEREYQRRVA
jgi:hypothetical protein